MLRFNSNKAGRIRELIDTLWNVNQPTSLHIAFIVRINRYIMECKYGNSSIITISHIELIDTLWNVNEDCKYCLKLDARELIDTLWNVN